MNEKLLILRKRSNLTQQQLADKIGIKRLSYTKIEQGSQSCSLEVAMKIAQLFNVGTDDIFLNKNVTMDNIESH